MYNKTKKIHFVGIGGIGMSGIAELLINLGYQVSGSDMRESGITRKLADLGGIINTGHDGKRVDGVDVVVTSSAIGADNPEVMAALDAHIPVIQRAEMLAELMRLSRYGIAIAGSHGKTSTTSLVAAILAGAGIDPTVVVGGKVDSLGGNAKLGCGDFLVAEADESDGSFLKLSPVIEVVTNIDLEHLEYYSDLDHIKDVFLKFIDILPFYGVAIICLDDDNIVSILPDIQRRIITYGLSEQADLYGADLKRENSQTSFTVFFKGKELGLIRINAPGRHTVYNTLAAIGVALELDIDFAVIARALVSFAGVQRRLQVKGERNGIMVIDDYGHHPTEIRATLDAVREGWPGRRLVVIFQPHRYSRTKALFAEFLGAFHRADILYISDVYGAGEEPLVGVSSPRLVSEIRRHGQRNVFFTVSLDDLVSEIQPVLKPGDIVLTLGAGNIVRVGEKLLDVL
jgi:UDP-N-acetylmuramate--alanine ligase